MGTGAGYPKKLKERAVRLVLEERKQHPSELSAITSVTGKPGCEALRTWVRQAQRDSGQRPELTTSDAERLKMLETQKRFKARIWEGGQEAPGEMVVVRCGEGEGSAACSRPERRQWADGCTARPGW